MLESEKNVECVSTFFAEASHPTFSLILFYAQLNFIVYIKLCHSGNKPLNQDLADLLLIFLMITTLLLTKDDDL